MITSLIKTEVMKKIFFLVLGLSLSTMLMAQKAKKKDSTPKEPKEHHYTKATFKSTQLINMQTVEMLSKGNLQFQIAHHFSYLWDKDAGSQNLAQVFGLNSGVAHTYLSFDYTPIRWGNIGFAFAGNSKFEGFVKFKILRQQTGAMNIPVTVGWYSMVNVDAAKSIDKVQLAWNKFSFLHQLIIARKFSDKFSLQLSPTWIHFNIVPYGRNNSNEVFALGLGARYRLSSKKAVNLEYSRQFNMYENLMDKNGNIIQYQPDLLSVGMEFNTGGHVFELFIGNTINSSAIDQLARNTSVIKNGQFALGFHMNRGFGLGGKK
jgi:hypothetical protein